MGYKVEVTTGNHNTFLGNHVGYGVDGSDDNNVASVLIHLLTLREITTLRRI